MRTVGKLMATVKGRRRVWPSMTAIGPRFCVVRKCNAKEARDYWNWKRSRAAKKRPAYKAMIARYRKVGVWRERMRDFRDAQSATSPPSGVRLIQ